MALLGFHFAVGFECIAMPVPGRREAREDDVSVTLSAIKIF